MVLGKLIKLEYATWTFREKNFLELNIFLELNVAYIIQCSERAEALSIPATKENQRHPCDHTMSKILVSLLLLRTIN
jgi:hypothetical protein